jgi:NAD(P)-dependent dehydrogenase (short-subunit alcohol dehydrogenase family)
MPNLSGKTALVTGASRGIGRASAIALAASGAQVLVHYGSGAKEADGVIAEIRGNGGRADAVAVDLATVDGPHKLGKQAHAVVGGRLDILVANAGVSKAATVEEQQLLPILSKGSSIVLGSSLAARGVVGIIPAYAATKGAVDTLVKHFASLLGANGIRVNAVAPGTNLIGLGDPVGFESLEEGRASQRKLASLSFDAAGFGHGKPIARDASTRFLNKWGKKGRLTA